MITNKNIVRHDVQGDSFGIIKSKVNQKKLAKLYNMLSNIYRNPIGAIVKEYSSNARDANIEGTNFKNLSWEEIQKKYSWVSSPDFPELNISEEEFITLKSYIKDAAKDEPVIVGVARDENDDYYFYVKDFGVGLSMERMEHIFFDYLSSTKEDTDDEIGGFGIGAKSALSYHHTFFIETDYNGFHYKYMMTKDKSGMPEGQLLMAKEHTEFTSNGTLIRVPIKGNDRWTFVDEINSKLLYMHNFYYDRNPIKSNPDGHGNPKFNQNVVLGNDLWKISSHYANNTGGMHIILDDIPYSIDWSELGISPITAPFGVVFKTGELQPTPSRESIIYTKHSISLLITRINEVKDYWSTKISENRVPTNSIFEFLQSKESNSGKSSFIVGYYGKENLPLSFYTSELFDTNMALSKPYKPFMDIDSRIRYEASLGLNPYSGIQWVDSDGKVSSFSSVRLTNRVIMNNHRYLITKDGTSIKQYKNHYHLLNSYGGGFYIVTKKKLLLKDYIVHLNLRVYDKSKWRSIIVAFQDIWKQFEDRIFGDYDALINPNWYKSYKANKFRFGPSKKSVVEDGEIRLKLLSMYKNDSSSNLDTRDVKMSVLRYDKNYNKGLYIYGASNDSMKLRAIRDLFIYMQQRPNNTGNMRKVIHPVIVYKSNFNHVEQLDNWHSIDNIENFEIRTFKRAATAYHIFKFLDENKESITYNLIKVLEDFAEELKMDISTLRAYETANSGSNFNKIVREGGEAGKLFESIYQIALRNDFIDKTVLAIIERLKNIQLPYLIRWYQRDLDISEKWEYANYLKQYGFKVNQEYYLSKEKYMASILIKDLPNLLSHQEHAYDETIAEEYERLTKLKTKTEIKNESN